MKVNNYLEKVFLTSIVGSILCLIISGTAYSNTELVLEGSIYSTDQNRRKISLLVKSIPGTDGVTISKCAGGEGTQVGPLPCKILYSGSLERLCDQERQSDLIQATLEVSGSVALGFLTGGTGLITSVPHISAAMNVADGVVQISKAINQEKCPFVAILQHQMQTGGRKKENYGSDGMVGKLALWVWQHSNLRCEVESQDEFSRSVSQRRECDESSYFSLEWRPAGQVRVIPNDALAGRLRGLYERYRATLDSDEIVDLYDDREPVRNRR